MLPSSKVGRLSHDWVVATQRVFGILTPKIGKDVPSLTSIFFRWVGSTTNQMINVSFI